MKHYSFILLLLINVSAFSQTATNFSCNDCSGKYYDLFTHLDSGKVVVICWVMPCATCVLPTKTTYNVVQSYKTSHPGKVKMIICDDFANSSCNTIESWVNANVFTNTLRFSDAKINMSHYGNFGMPKVVVLAGTGKKVYFNQNDIINATKLQDAINLAGSETSSVSELNAGSKISIYPNPVSGSELTISLPETEILKISIYNISGQLTEEINNHSSTFANQLIRINTENYIAGIYYCRISAKDEEHSIKFIVLP